MAATTLVQTRIDPALKECAAAVLERMGPTVSDAVHIWLTRIANEGALSFPFATDPACLPRPSDPGRSGVEPRSDAWGPSRLGLTPHPVRCASRHGSSPGQALSRRAGEVAGQCFRLRPAAPVRQVAGAWRP